jgi:hypothetical protein
MKESGMRARSKSGLLTYDRRPKLAPELVAEINREMFRATAERKRG